MMSRYIKKLLSILVFSLFFSFDINADDKCTDKNPEIILDLGGSPDPEKIVYSTYDSCTKQSDYCGANGCALDIFDDKGEYGLGYIAKDDWYIRPVNIVGQKPTFELIVPLSNGKLRVVKIIDGKLTEIIIDR